MPKEIGPAEVHTVSSGQTRSALAQRYALAIFSVVLTTLLRFALNPILGRKAAFILYFPALVFSAWLGGWLGGILALALSMIAAIFFFISPNHTLFVTGTVDEVTLLIFLLVGLSVSALSASQRKALGQKEEARKQAQVAAEEAKQRGQDLEASEARYRHLLETANEGVLTVDTGDKIIYINPRLAEMLKYGIEELKGHLIYDLLFPEDAEMARRRRGERRQGVQEQYELRLRRQDGSEVWTVANVSVLWENKEYAGTFSLLTDITERKRAEAELQSAYARESLINRIGLAVRSTSTSQSILQVAVAELGKALGADRCYYVTYDSSKDEGILAPEWHREGLPSILGTFPMSDYQFNSNSAFRGGQTHVVEDCYLHPDSDVAHRYNLRALVRVPLPHGNMLSVLSVAMSDQPRVWKADEIALVETVAAQTRAALEAAQAGQRERGFLRDVLASVTEGKLLLSSTPSQLPSRLSPVGDVILLTRESGLRDLRLRTQEAARAADMSDERQHDLITAVSEAGMNAILHGGGGTGQVSSNSAGTIQVRVEDHGAGISMESLPLATLSRGFSTKATLGHGLKMILEMADRLYLMTGPTGTTVVLEQDRDRPLPAWL